MIKQVIEIANNESCLVSYNHPIWSLQNYSDYINLEGIWGVEWFNNGLNNLISNCYYSGGYINSYNDCFIKITR